MSQHTINRRTFLKTTAITGTAASFLPPYILRGRDDQKVRMGLIGVGLRGRNHLNLLLRRDDVEVVAICDIDPDALLRSQEMISKAGKKAAKEITGSELAYRDLLADESIAGVIIATPWLWHTRMAVDTMRSGKYAGVEVSAANTLEECWDLVNTYEETGKPCMILENVCYRRDVMAVLNMVRQNLFGELIHLECGYQHDLREVKFNDGKQPYGGGVEFGEKGFSEAKWRTYHSIHRNGDLYPTHGIGPVGNWININRGNRFVSLTSTASKSRGLHKYIVDNAGPDHPNADIRFKLGDVVTTVIRTINGESIIVSHDTNSPRPYSLGFRVQGTQGIWMDLNKSLYIEGVSPRAHRWEEAEPYLQKYDHPLWKRYAERATGAGHGGMDFFVVHAFVESVKRGMPTPLDAYDAAAWSAITPLSETSIAMGNAPVDFPDFTRGRWMQRKPVFAFGDSY
ncbi:MAG: Gfo/Idh/MocA family oxidoreductase [Saprospiraceae bacterium]|nr:Gfo/Idh/MocA family oxidoreductase [Saprospiraceae bacterium]